jgi:FkbM family methyltransferase
MPVGSIERLIQIAGGPERVRTVLDVGANDGSDSLPYASRYPSARFLAIEPTPVLAHEIRRESATLANYTVVECAVGLDEGAQTLQIRGHTGHNSLAPIDHAKVAGVAIDPHVYAVREQATVDVRRLESICAEHEIDRIDVLHVDAQGSDFDVLVSAGDLLRTVRAGVVEVPRRLALYENTASRAAFARYLRHRGLRVVDISANDHLNHEQNLFFAPARAFALRLNRIVYPFLVARSELRFLLWRVRDGLRVRLAHARRARA